MSAEMTLMHEFRPFEGRIGPVWVPNAHLVTHMCRGLGQGFPPKAPPGGNVTPIGAQREELGVWRSFRQPTAARNDPARRDRGDVVTTAKLSG